MLIFTLMKQKKQIIIFTDLDGSLLDKDTFRFDEIENYFRELISIGIKIIPNSSKTEAELSDFNNQYNLNLSFIAENGSSIHGLNLIHKNLPNNIFLSRTVDVLMAIPQLIFALVLLSIFGSTVTNLILIIAILDSTRVFRLTRAVSLNVVVMDYVEAARLRGEGLSWVMRKEILPNIWPPLIAEFGLRFCFVFLSIAALSFLGVGIQPPTADWGSMVRENASLIQFAQYDLKAAMTPLLPAAAIALLTVAVNFVVDWFLHKTSGIKDEK